MSFLDVVKRPSQEEPQSEALRESKLQENTPVIADDPNKRKKPKTKSRVVIDESAMLSPHTSPSATRSRFSLLNSEIVFFQGMVRQLESILNRSGDTPEDQWKSRILLQSATDADRDLREKIDNHGDSIRYARDPNVLASYSKLNRDYKRAHDGFHTLSGQYNERQHDAITKLEDEHGFLSPMEMQKKQAEKQEEDFFVRKMKEREAEVSHISNSINQVNKIYQDLGRIVQEQQEQIDHVGEKIKDAKYNTEAGLDQFQKMFHCPGDGSDERPRDDPPQLISEEDFHCMLPFETFGDSIKDVVKTDIMGLGSDIVKMTRDASGKLRNASTMLQCASEDDVSNHRVVARPSRS